MAEHTALPWRVDGPFRTTIVCEARPIPIASTTYLATEAADLPEDQANAEYIVRCANSYTEMAEALRWIETYITNQPLDSLAQFLITEKARAILARLEES